jgi:secreted Zn-dependent insulinase-like peptidase
MKKIITKLPVLLLLLISHTSTSATFNKNPNDPRINEIFVLDNGIQVVTVDDANTHLSAATLLVGVGQYQDPITHQGLAHLLEHMVFLGSKLYSKPGEFLSFISEGGGDTKVFKAKNQTTQLRKTKSFN